MRRVPLAILTASLALLIGVERAHSQSSSQSSSSSKQGSAASPQDQSGRTGTSDTQRSSDLQQDNQRPSTGQRSDQDTGTRFDRGQDSRMDDRGQTMDRDRAGQGYDRQGIGSNFPGYRWGYGQPYGDWNRRYGGYQGMYGNFPSDMYGGYGWSGNQMNDSKARLLVIVPPDAQVWVDDQPTRSMGPQRLYVSPPLDQGTYSYTVRATWTQDGREVSREKKVKVQPDQMSSADFMAQGRTDQYGSDEAAPRGAEQRQNLDRNRPTPDTDRNDLDQNRRTPDANRNELDRNRPTPDTKRDNRPRPGETDGQRTDQQTPAAGQVNESNRAGQTFSGTIVRAENDQIVVTLQNGAERTFKVPADARITSDGQKADLRSLKAGMHVSLTANADNSVSTIEATKATTNK